VQEDLDQIRANADEVVSSAKEDFPSETKALRSSVDALATAVDQLPPEPTAQQVLGLTAAIDSTVTASKDLSNATESACD
jgi:hypothetical protein